MQDDDPKPIVRKPSIQKQGTPHKPVRFALVFAFNAFLAIALIIGGAFLLNQRAEAVAPVAATKPLKVMVETALRQSGYEIERRFAGRIEAARQAALASELGGTVIEISVREGQRVKRGALIAKLDIRSLQASRAQQRARRRALSKDRELAQLDANRQLELKRQGYTSGQAWDAARLRVEGLNSSLAQIDAGLRGIRVNVSKSEVRAPFDGVIGARLVDEGSTLSPGAAVVTLFEKARPQVRVGLPSRTAARLQEQNNYVLDVEGRQVPATLEQLRPDLNNITRTVTAIFELNMADIPRFGQIAQLVLTEQRPEPGYWLPLTALKEGERGLWDVMVIHQREAIEGAPAGEVVARESVEVLHADGKRAYVRGTLPNNALYIADGLHRITVGQLVRSAQQ